MGNNPIESSTRQFFQNLIGENLEKAWRDTFLTQWNWSKYYDWWTSKGCETQRMLQPRRPSTELLPLGAQLAVAPQRGFLPKISLAGLAQGRRWIFGSFRALKAHGNKTGLKVNRQAVQIVENRCYGDSEMACCSVISWRPSTPVAVSKPFSKAAMYRAHCCNPGLRLSGRGSP